ncbi:endothelin-converting enzyme 1-like [Amblyomma americanum]
MGQKYELAETIAGGIKGSALPLHADWMDESTLEQAKQRLQRTRFVIGLGSKAGGDSRRDYKHVKPATDAQAFALWLLNGLKAGRKRLHDAIFRGHTLPHADVGDEFQASGSSPNAFFDPVRLEVVVSPTLLFPPFYVEEAPSAVYYGALGSLIGSQLAQSLDPAIGAHDMLGRKLTDSWCSPDSLAARNQSVQCIANKMVAYLGNPVTDQQANEVLAHTLGLRIAHAAYRKQLAGNGTNPAASNFDQSWSGPFGTVEQDGAMHRLFFAAYCFQLCGVALPSSYTRALSSRVRCNLPLMNYSEFGRAFRCPLDSPMYAPTRKKCMPDS